MQLPADFAFVLLVSAARDGNESIDDLDDERREQFGRLASRFASRRASCRRLLLLALRGAGWLTPAFALAAFSAAFAAAAASAAAAVAASAFSATVAGPLFTIAFAW